MPIDADQTNGLRFIRKSLEWASTDSLNSHVHCFLQDVRFAAEIYWKKPGSITVMIVMAGLGIGDWPHIGSFQYCQCRVASPSPLLCTGAVAEDFGDAQSRFAAPLFINSRVATDQVTANEPSTSQS